jgi:ATP-dependent Clp protease ATP-binding subunit ClpA
VAYNPLSFEITERVVDKFIAEVNAQLAEKNITVKLTESARAWLAKNGFDRLYGARPMARLIQTKIKQPLAEKLLFGSEEMGGQVLVDEQGGELALDFSVAANAS